MSELLLFVVGLMAGALAATLVLLPRVRASELALELLQSELTSSRHERGELEAELAAARETVGDASTTDADAELRRKMDEIADLIMHGGTAPRETER